MCRRSPDVPGCISPAIRVLFWFNLLGYLNSQRIPSRDSHYAFGIDQRNLFYDNNRIPDGLEVSPYLFHNTSKKFFFLLEDSTDRLEISLTPCASPIVWHVTHKILKGDKQLDANEQGDKGIDNLKPVSEKAYLYTATGDRTETLRLDQPKPGIYTVEILSTQSDSYVQVFAATSPEVNRFPELPVDRTLNISKVTSQGFKVTWHASPDEPHFNNEIEYCVSASRRTSFQTLCSVVSHLNGDAKPTLPPGSGFGFSFDSSRKKILKQSAKPVKAAKKGTIHFTCVGQEKTFVFGKIKKGRNFFVTVFVRNKVSGKSRPYTSTNVKIKRRRKFHTLKDGKSKSVVLSKKKKSKSYKFQIKGSARDMVVSINTCGGPILLNVYSGNMTLYNSRVSSELISLKDLPVGRYGLTLTKASERRQNVRLRIKTLKKVKNIPELPADRKVEVFDYLTSCDSITVAWMGTKINQKYCLYKTVVPPNSNAHALPIFKRLDQCSAFKRLDKGSTKITCKKFKYSRKSNSVLAITVKGLRKDKTYIFDVFVNIGKHFTFPYGSVRTKTKNTGCYLPT